MFSRLSLGLTVVNDEQNRRVLGRWIRVERLETQEKFRLVDGAAKRLIELFVGQSDENALEIHQTENRIGVEKFHLVEHSTEQILVDQHGQRGWRALERIAEKFVEFLANEILRETMRLDADQTAKELTNPLEQQGIETLHGNLNAEWNNDDVKNVTFDTNSFEIRRNLIEKNPR